VIDQGVFAGSSFVTSILLARWLTADAFGAFAIAYAVSTLVVTAHTAVLGEPLSVYGAGKYASAFGRYTRFLLAGHAAAVLVLGLLVGASGMVVDRWSSPVAHALFAMAVVTPLAPLSYLVRGLAYVRFMPQASLLAGAFAAIVQIGGVVLLQTRHALTPASGVIVCLGLSPMVYTLVLARLLRQTGSVAVAEAYPAVAGHSFVHDHLSYARWSLPSAATLWIGANAQIFLLSAHTGLSGAGEIRALDNLIAPYWQYMSALSGLLVPLLSRAMVRHGTFETTFRKIMVIFIAQGLVASAVLVLGRSWIVHLLYGNRYDGLIHLLPWLVLILLPNTACVVLFAACRAAIRPNLVFAFNLTSSVILTVGYAFFLHYGASGVVGVRIVVYSVLTGILWTVTPTRASTQVRVNKPASTVVG
jgi:O-antigen/teichoic acid export membrane protein